MTLNRSRSEHGEGTIIRWRTAAFLAVFAVAMIAAARHDARQAHRVSAATVPDHGQTSLSAARAFAEMPMRFEANAGQVDPQVKFLSRGSRYELFLTQQEAVLELESTGRKVSVLRMGLNGANAQAELDGSGKLPGASNYLIGNDPSKWHRNVPQFASVRYRQVYPGIDLVYYGSQGQLEYDFEVAPGADARAISLNLTGAQKISFERHGDLALKTSGGEVRLQSPQVYQRVGAERHPVSGRFVRKGASAIGFEVGDYDRTKTLVIDPVESYSTYLGGSGVESCSTIIGSPVSGTTAGGVDAGVPRCPAVAVDTAQNIYLAGSTMSTDFPNPNGTHPTLLGTANVFIAKLNPSAASSSAQLIFSTYLGGNGIDYTAGIAVDSGFNIAVAGTTSSSNFPASLGYQPGPPPAGNHVFATKLDSSGSILKYSTYLYGSGADMASGLALDTSGQIYLTGTTTSSNFPTLVGDFQTTAKGPTQFFFSKINPALTGTTSLLYSTYIGGSTANGATPVTIGGGIAVDSSFSVYVSGGTNYADMPVLSAYQAYKSGLDAYVAKFLFPQNSQTPPSLSYLTYFGGSGDDIAYGVGVDSAFNAYIVGSTTSSDIALATSTTPFQSALDCPPNPVGGTCPASPTAADAFVARFGVLCTATSCSTTTLPLSYFSYLGGTGTDIGLDIAVDSIAGARITGWTNSTDFHTLNAPANLLPGGGIDAFVARIDTTSNSTTSLSHFSTYLGGSGTDIGSGIAVDTLNNTYVTGETTSINFPYDNPYQTALNGPSDVFATKLGSLANLSVTESAAPSPVGVGNNVTFTYTVTNNGDAVTGLNFNSVLPASGATFVSASASPGSCGAASSGSVGCTLGTLNGGATATVTVVLTPTVAQPLGNTGTISIAGSSYTASPVTPASVVVNDFLLGVSPNTQTVPAGVPATYTLTVGPSVVGSTIPNSVSLACGSGLPTGATCSFTNNPIPNLSSGAQGSTLVINSTARVTTTTQLRGGPRYATLLPIFGLAFLGVGIGGVASRKSRLLSGLMVAGFLALVVFSAGCSSSKTTTTTTGTPAGTYTLVINATSGTVTHSQTITYVVQ